MSYTIPDYVDTKEQAVLAVASAIKGEAVTGGDGSVNRALDILADVLAEQDVQVPQTNAGAILALAQYASGMVKPEGTIAITENGEGIDVSQYATADVSVSGGASFGDTLFPFFFTASAPVVGGGASESEACWFNAALVGGKTAALTEIAVTNGYAAAGVVIKTNALDFTSCKAYKVVVDPDSETYSSVTEVEGIVEKVDTPYDTWYYLVTMPELQGTWSEGWYEGEQLHIYTVAP